MSVARCILQGSSISSLDDLYDQLSQCCQFPPHFGRNLDALWDVLSTDVVGPIEIVWEDAAVSQAALGDAFDKICTLFRDLEQERDDVTVEFR